MKSSIIGGDLKLPYADWNGHAEKSRGNQVFLNRLVWENSNTQIVQSTTQGNALLNTYLVWRESALTSCSNVQGISDQCGVLHKVEWGENCCRHKVERSVPVYHKTNISSLQRFLRSKFASWASNGETAFESIDHFVPYKIMRKNPEYYNKEVKQLKAKVKTV